MIFIKVPRSATAVTYTAVDTDIGTVAYTVGNRRYLNITNRCTLSCRFCPRVRGTFELGEHNLRLAREPEINEVLAGIGDARNYEEIVFCGLGEPTLRLYDMLEVSARVRRPGVKVRLVTDGLATLVHRRSIAPDLEGLIDTLWISLNAQDAATYDQLCRPPCAGAYDAMLEFVDEAREYVPQITLTAIAGVEGVDLDACDRVASSLGVDFFRRRLGQIG